jgi:hypothetical protein
MCYDKLSCFHYKKNRASKRNGMKPQYKTLLIHKKKREFRAMLIKNLLNPDQTPNNRF